MFKGIYELGSMAALARVQAFKPLPDMGLADLDARSKGKAIAATTGADSVAADRAFHSA